MTNLEITEEEAKVALSWWEKPQAWHLHTPDKKFVSRLKEFIGEENGTANKTR